MTLTDGLKEIFDEITDDENVIVKRMLVDYNYPHIKVEIEMEIKPEEKENKEENEH